MTLQVHGEYFTYSTSPFSWQSFLTGIHIPWGMPSTKASVVVRLVPELRNATRTLETVGVGRSKTNSVPLQSNDYIDCMAIPFKGIFGR